MSETDVIDNPVQSDEIQQWMLNALISPMQVTDDDTNRLFTGSANLTAKDCLGIYQRSYILRLSKCLEEQFPALCHALGKPLFDQFAQQYLQNCPSDSHTLYELGRRFSAYLNEVRPDRDLPEEQQESWIDFMVDLAHYERLHFKLFDAHGHEGNPWPTADALDSHLVLQPCFELVAYRYPVAWYYHQVKSQQEVRFPKKQESHLVLLRKDYTTTTFPISKLHYLFLSHLQSSSCIEQSLAHIANITQTSTKQVYQSWVKEIRVQWINAGFFISNI